jgi:hypothetical protein
MRKMTNFNKAFPDKSNPNTNDESEEMEEWRDEHGQPSAHYLQELAEDDSEESLEKLRGIAEDMDIEYEDDTPANELIDKILSADSNDSMETA